MKRLYVRFFNGKYDILPRDSRVISENNISTELESVQEWLDKHPNGKVDFVWLD